MTAHAQTCQEGKHVFRWTQVEYTSSEPNLYRDPEGCDCGEFRFSGYRDGKPWYASTWLGFIA